MRGRAWLLALAVAGAACGGDGEGSGEGGLDEGSAGPWPREAALDYSARYGLGTALQAVGLDAGGTLWLLDPSGRVGVLRAGDTAPTWTAPLGQGAKGFRASTLCGGEAGRAYVGYLAEDLSQPRREDLNDPVFAQGDADAVRVGEDGQVTLEAHLDIRNTNDRHFDEDRSVLTCTRVTRGRFRGEVYVGTNHGVTRVRGLEYDAHRHPVFKDASGSLRIGYMWAVGVGQEGQVLAANEWKVGIVTPPEELKAFSDMARTPWTLDTYVEALGSQEEMDRWRGFAQARDGRYWLGSASRGVWSLQVSPRAYAKLQGLPTDRITALGATPDGALLIGTEDQGLWRKDAEGKVAKVAEVPGARVKQLVVDDGLSPAMVLVLTDKGLTVLRVED